MESRRVFFVAHLGLMNFLGCEHKVGPEPIVITGVLYITPTIVGL